MSKLSNKKKSSEDGNKTANEKRIERKRKQAAKHAREYRARKRKLCAITDELIDNLLPNVPMVGDSVLTHNALRVREYLEMKKAKKNRLNVPKTPTERKREYRRRKKAKTAAKLLSDAKSELDAETDANSGSQTVYSSDLKRLTVQETSNPPTIVANEVNTKPSITIQSSPTEMQPTNLSECKNQFVEMDKHINIDDQIEIDVKPLISTQLLVTSPHPNSPELEEQFFRTDENINITDEIEIDVKPLISIQSPNPSPQNPPKHEKPFVETNEKINITDQFVCEIIDKSIAYQLKGLKETQLTIAEKLISDVILYAKMNQLTANSCVNIAPSTTSAVNPSSSNTVILIAIPPPSTDSSTPPPSTIQLNFVPTSTTSPPATPSNSTPTSITPSPNPG